MQFKVETTVRLTRPVGVLFSKKPRQLARSYSVVHGVQAASQAEAMRKAASVCTRLFDRQGVPCLLRGKVVWQTAMPAPLPSWQEYEAKYFFSMGENGIFYNSAPLFLKHDHSSWLRRFLHHKPKEERQIITVIRPNPTPTWLSNHRAT